MDCRVIFTDTDGNCCVMHVVHDPKKGSKCKNCPTETDEEFALRVAKEDAPEGASNFRVCCKTKVPTDRTFRNCWEQDLTESDEEICVCMEKARKVHLNRCRKHRNMLLEKLDKEMMRAIEDGNDADIKRLKVRKQKLRDMPMVAELEFAACNCPKELAKKIPEALAAEDITEIEPVGGDENPNQ